MDSKEKKSKVIDFLRKVNPKQFQKQAATRPTATIRNQAEGADGGLKFLSKA